MNFSIKYVVPVRLLISVESLSYYSLKNELQSHVVNEKHFVVMFVCVYTEDNMGFGWKKNVCHVQIALFSSYVNLFFFLRYFGSIKHLSRYELFSGEVFNLASPQTAQSLFLFVLL